MANLSRFIIFCLKTLKLPIIFLAVDFESRDVGALSYPRLLSFETLKAMASCSEIFAAKI